MTKASLILGELSDRDIDWMVINGKRETIQAGTILIEEDCPLDALYIVLDGTLSASVAGLGNQEVGKIRKGEVLGEMSFVDGRLPSATVKAIEDSQVLSISRQLLTQKLEDDPLFSLRFYRAITKFLSSRLRATVSHFGGDEKTDGMLTKSPPIPLSESNLNEDGTAYRFDWIMERLASSDYS